jgi:hypothetical protein
MADEWTVKDLIEALKRFALGAKVYCEMGPNGPGIIDKAQYVWFGATMRWAFYSTDSPGNDSGKQN